MENEEKLVTSSDILSYINADLFEPFIEHMRNNIFCFTYGDIKAIDFLKDYRTIKIKLPRRSGNTTVLANFAGKFTLPLIVMPTNRSTEFFTDRYPNLAKCDIISSTSQDSLDKLRGKKYDAVLVDAASMLDNVSIDRLYNHLISITNVDEVVILLIG